MSLNSQGVFVGDQEGALVSIIDSYCAEVDYALKALPVADVVRLVHLLHEVRGRGGQVFLVGNGGSAATASHMACDLAKGASVAGQPDIKALSATDNAPLLTAWSNDLSYTMALAQWLTPWLKAGDVLIAISTGGNSPNILEAVKAARRAGATTVGLTGTPGGKLKGLVDIPIVVHSKCIKQTEDVHLLLGHIITTCLRNLAHSAGGPLLPQAVKVTVNPPGQA